MVACRKRLAEVHGDAMGLLHSLVHLDPAARLSMKEVLLSGFFEHLRERESNGKEKGKATRNRSTNGKHAYTLYERQADSMLLDV